MSVNQIGVQFSPSFHVLNKDDSIKFDAIYYNFNYNYAPVLANGQEGSRNLADELDLAAEYAYDAKTSFYALFGYSSPGTGVKQTISNSVNQGMLMPGLNKNIYLFEAFITRAF
jgi:hypothetical protein